MKRGVFRVVFFLTATFTFVVYVVVTPFVFALCIARGAAQGSMRAGSIMRAHFTNLIKNYLDSWRVDFD